MYIGSLPAASNRARYVLSLTVFDAEEDEAFDLTDFDITFSIREPNGGSALLTASDDDGVDMTNADDGLIEITFTPAQMRTLCAKQYDVGCTIAADDDEDIVDQFIIGTLQVLDGVVT